MANHEDIAITGLTQLATYRSEEQPSMFNMVLSLSASPDPEWIRLFDRSRSVPRNENWRAAIINGASLVITCAPLELQDQIDEVKHDIFQANLRFKEIAAERARAQAARKAGLDLDLIREIASRLRF